MSNQVTWTITEMQQGQEVDAYETYSYQHACAIMCDYTEDDKLMLSPCIYKNLPDGTRTAEI